MQTQRLLTALSANAFGAGVYSPAAFNVRVGIPVVVIVSSQSSSADAHAGGDLTISDDGVNDWIPLVTSTTHPNWGMGIRAWGLNPKADASITLSIDAGAFSIDNYRVLADALIGPRRIRLGASGIGSDADGDAAASVTLSSASSPGSLVYGVANRANGTGAAGTITAGAEWIQVDQVSRTDWWVFQAQVRAGGFGVTVPWTDLSVGGVPVGATLVAFELLDDLNAPPALDLLKLAHHWKPQRWDFPLGQDLLLDDFLPSTATGFTATASITFGALTVVGVADVRVDATASITFGALAVSSSAAILVEAQGSIAFGSFTTDADATVGDGAELSASITFGTFTAAGTATVRVDATASISFGAFSVGAAAAVRVDAQASITFGPFSVVGVADNGDAPPAPGGGDDWIQRRRRRRRP